MRRLTLDLAVPVILAATIVAFAAGSSSVAAVVRDGRAARWAALLALCLVAAAWVGRPVARIRPAVALSAVGFLTVAVESAAWSVNPRLTIERAATLVVLFATAVALASACAGRLDRSRRVLWGIVAGALIVTALGLVTLAVDHAAAVQVGTFDVPARYRGFGQNPDTVSLLLALCLPICTWLAFEARNRRERALALAAAFAFDASIAASGSRGAIGAGFVGVFVVVVLVRTPVGVRALAGCAAAVLLAATIAVALAPTSKGNTARPKSAASTAAGVKPKPGYIDVGVSYPFEFDIGFQGPGEAAPTHRTLFGLSGRGEAWRGAIDLGNARPALGYGFGTEDRVFINRYTNFVGGLPENSYIGIYLQLGAVGLALFLALVGALGAGAIRRESPEAIVTLAVLAGALVLAIVQSYIYSVGDIGTLTVWVCAFLGAAATRRRESA